MPLPDSPHMGLTRPAGTDPFLRDDFITNWDLLDEYPGTFVCTSTSRPSWGAAQAGMTILETDTGKQQRWDGTGWQPMEVYPRAGRYSVSVNTALSAGAQATYTLTSSLTTFRPCTINIIMAARIQKAANTPQNITIDPWIDGTDAAFGFSDLVGFPDGPSGTSAQYHAIPVILGSRAVSHIGSQTHSLAVHVTVASGNPNQITVEGFKAIVFLSET